MKASSNFISKTKKLFRILGPGLITGASDDDPSGSATYSQAGAKFGLATLWTSLNNISFNGSSAGNVCKSWFNNDGWPYYNFKKTLLQAAFIFHDDF